METIVTIVTLPRKPALRANHRCDDALFASSPLRTQFIHMIYINNIIYIAFFVH